MRSRAIVAAIVLAGAVGCTSTEGGTATTSTAETTTTTAKKSEPSKAAMPPRPKEITLDAVDPCALLTKAQSDQLKIQRSRSVVNKSDTYNGMKQCMFAVSDDGRFYDYSALLVTTEGAEAWLTEKRNVEVEQITVAGFGAARYYLRGATGTNAKQCTTAVDVADGQQLQVDITVTTRGVYTVDQLCQMSQAAAELAMTTLQTLG